MENVSEWLPGKGRALSGEAELPHDTARCVCPCSADERVLKIKNICSKHNEIPRHAHEDAHNQKSVTSFVCCGGNGPAAPGPRGISPRPSMATPSYRPKRKENTLSAQKLKHKCAEQHYS